MFKCPKYAYIGLQANIALVISLAQEGGPPVDLAPPLQRLGGIVIGIIASFIVANLLWRSDIWTMLNRYLKKLHILMTHNMQQLFLVVGNQKKLHDLANLFWDTRGLLESLADESLSPKKQSTLTELIECFESLVMTQATMSHILLAIDRDKVQDIADLIDCPLSFYEQKILTSFTEHDRAGGLKLSQQLSLFLSEIGDKLTLFQVAKEDLRAFLSYLNALNQLALRIY